MRFHVDADDGCDVDGVPLCNIWPVTPLAHGVESGFAEEMMSAEDVDSGNLAGLGDNCL